MQVISRFNPDDGEVQAVLKSGALSRFSHVRQRMVNGLTSYQALNILLREGECQLAQAALRALDGHGRPG